MGDAPIVLQRRVVTSFKRHLNLGDYNTCELFMSVEDYVDLEASPEDVAAKLRDLAATVKATVIDEVGLEFELSEQGVILEKLRQDFGPSTQIVQTSGGDATVSTRTTVNLSPTPPHDPKSLDWKNPAHKGPLAENRAWAAEQYLADASSCYDNRASKRNEKGPDFKHKSSEITFWESDVAKVRR